MKRTILILAAAALMAMVMAATVSPALAAPGGNGNDYGWATGPTYGWGTDADGDGLKKYEDNCPNYFNPNQEYPYDYNGDGTKDSCVPPPPPG